MTDDTPDDGRTESLDAVTRPHSSTVYRVLGELAAEDGVGVLGHNTATTGAAVGIQGATDAAAGYGLYTPDDARVGGTAELAALSGSLTGDTQVTDLTGEGLAVDGSGAFGWSVTYEKNRLTDAGTTWTPVSGLSSETPVEVTVGTPDLDGGKVRLEVDGAEVAEVIQGGALHRIVGATSSVSLVTEEYFAAAASFGGLVDDRPESIAFQTDGSKMFVVLNGSDSVVSYDISTAWEVDTASSTGNSFSISAQSGSPSSLAFKDDGTKMYVLDSRDITVYSYLVTTGWDLTTAEYRDDLYDLSARSDSPTGLAFKDDGTKMFVSDEAVQQVFSYTLTTAWDVETAGYETRFDVSGDVSNVDEVAFESDGTTMYVFDRTADRVYWYDLSTAWDITSASLSDSLDNTAQTTDGLGVTVRGDGEKLYVIDGVNTDVYQYDEVYSGVANASVKRE